MLKIGRQKIWTVQFNPMVYESAYATISMHKTKKGAMKAMQKHKEFKLKEFKKREEEKKKYNPQSYEILKFDISEWDRYYDWNIRSEYLLD